jgi:hypothetical protein
MRTRGSFFGIKWPGREADHSLPSSAAVKECAELYIHSPICPYGVVLSLKKAQGQLYLLTFYNNNNNNNNRDHVILGFEENILVTF